jgi:hypothetical protein
MLIAISIAAGVIMAALLFRLFFKGFSDFIECLRFYFQPNIISLFRGELVDDFWGSLRLGVWVVLSLIVTVGTYVKVGQFFPGLKPENARISARSSYNQPKTTSSAVESDEPDGEVETAVPASAIPVSQARQVSNLPPGREAKVGDVVEISALKPAIALRRATVTSVDAEQITVRSSSDSYTIQWKDVAALKPSTAAR